MNAREDILAAIRMRRTGVHTRPPRYRVPTDADDLLRRFAERAIAESAEVRVIDSMADVPAAVADLLRARNMAASVHIPLNSQMDALPWSVAVERVPPGPNDAAIAVVPFAIAETGMISITENEGNARLTTSAPKIHIAVAGIEKVIPRAQDLAVFLKLLARSATGQLLSVYTSFLAGPRRPGEVDGPEEFYVVLLDNGRTKLLPDRSKRQSLYCIRCGACLNTCPVYRKIGGHSFPWVYSGPIGANLTPQFMGAQHEPALPFASSLCGACGEVCPVKIDIPKHLLTLRHEITEMRTRDGQNKLEKLAFRMWSFAMRASSPFSGALRFLWSLRVYLGCVIKSPKALRM